jgi:hypothetical protein
MGRRHKILNNYPIFLLALFSIILFSGIFITGIPEASAATIVIPLDFNGVSTDFDAWTTGDELTDADAKLNAIASNDTSTSYITSIINNDIQGFTSGVDVLAADSINYIRVVSIADKTDEARKATKFSQGLAMGGVPIALPNGGVELNTAWTQFNQTFYTNPFSGKNEKNQDPWTLDDIPLLEYIIEQNTDTKEVRVTQFYAEISIEITPTITITNSPPTIPWGHTATIYGETTNIQNNFTIEVDWGDGTIDTIPASANWSATHEYEDDSSSTTQTVTATLITGAEAPSDSVDIAVEAHDTSLNVPQLTPLDKVKWGKTFNVSNTLTDDEAVLCTGDVECPSTVELRTITYSGDAIEGSFDGTSSVIGLELTASQDVGTEKSVIAAFAGDDTYNLSSSQTTIEIERHDTSIEGFVTAGELVSTNTPFSVLGVLVDTDRENLGINDQPITLTLSDLSTMPSATTGGATIDSSASDNSSDLEVAACEVCTNGIGSNVTLLETGDKIIFDVPVTWATLYFEEGGVKTLNSGALGLPQKIVFHDGNSDAGFYVVYGPGVSEISINSITGDGTDIALTRITASNEEANINIIDENLSYLPTGSYSSIDIAGGSFSSTGVAPSIDGPYDVTAEFAGDGLYKKSTAIDSFNLEENQASEGGIGGSLNVVADAGTGYTGIICGADGDNDSICAGWEGVNGKTFGVNGITHYLQLPDRSDSKKNIYIEIDYMKDHKPKQEALDMIIAKFEENNIALTIFVDEELTHVDTMNIWTDNDNIPTNDFDSIKANHYGFANERSSATGQNSNISSKDAKEKTLTITGIKVTTPEHSDRIWNPNAPDDLTQGTILIKSKVTTDAIRTLTVPSTIDKPLSIGEGLEVISRPSVSVLPIPGTEHVVTISVPFKTTVTPDKTSGALNDVSLGILTVPIIISDNGATATVSEYPNSPHASSTLTEAYAQLVRYMIFGHSQGGPSGTAEFMGNDAVVTLGEGFGGTTPNHSGSVGTIKEQAGTVMHEIGHWLGLKHGGPEKINGVAVPDADVNCNPLNTGVMPYSRQTNAYLGPLWEPDFSHGKLDSITESALDEEKGFFSSSAFTTYHLFVNGNGFVGKPNSYTTNDPIRSVNFNADGDIDTEDVQVDLNNFGFPGCNTSDATQTFNDYDEWANLKFNWKDTVSGQFDGGNPNHPTPNGDLNADNSQLQKLQGLQFFGAIPPPAPDGTEIRKAGSTLPLKIPIFDGDGNPIDFAKVTARYLTDANGPPTGDIADSSGETLFVYDNTGDFYNLNWKTPKKEGVYWITVYVENPSNVGPSEWALVDYTNDPVLTDEAIPPNEITVKVTLVK